MAAQPYTADELSEVSKRLTATELAAISAATPLSITDEAEQRIQYAMHDVALRIRLQVAAHHAYLAASMMRLRDEVAR